MNYNEDINEQLIEHEVNMDLILKNKRTSNTRINTLRYLTKDPIYQNELDRHKNKSRNS